MRSILRDLRRDLQTFLDQRDDLALVVACRPREAVWLARVVDEIDRVESPDLTLLVVEEFHRADVFVDRVVEAFGERHAAVVRAQRERGVAQWPPLPEELADGSLDEVARMRALASFARGLVSDDRRLILALLPLRITDWGAWGVFIASLVEFELPFPWCERVRLILRDDPGNPVLRRRLGLAPALRFRQFVVDNDRLRAHLMQSASERSESLESRVADVLAIAMLDASERRFAEAEVGYNTAHRFYERTLNREMMAVVDLLHASLHNVTGARDAARAKLERACTNALDADALWLVPSITGALGELAVRQEDWAAGEVFFVAAAATATGSINARHRAEALTVVGLCRYLQERVDDALEAWTSAAESARAIGDPALVRPVLQRLREHYRQRGEEQQHAAIENELAGIDRT